MHKTISIIKIIICWLITILCAILSITGTLLLRKKKSVPWLGRHMWGPWLLGVLGCELEIEQNEKIDFDKPHVFFMNHQSAIDVLVAYTVIPVDISFIAKKELKWVPFLGWAMQAAEMIFVDRSSPKRAVKSMKIAADKVRQGKNIIAYPEGTRTKTGDLRPFKKGTFVTAMQAKVDLVPIAVVGAREVYGAQGSCVTPGIVKVKFGEPISCKELDYLSNQDRVKVTQEGEEAMRLLLDEMRQAPKVPDAQTAEVSA